MSAAEEPTKVAEVQPEAETKVEETAKVEETQPEEKAEEKSEEKVEETAEAKSEEKTEEKTVKKTTARINEKDYSQNKKFDPRQLPESNDPLEMRAQTEFYFNNANLPTDEHMWKLTGGPENKPVELKHLHTFGRMRRFPDYAALVAAIKESDLLEISGEEGAEVIKRKVPYKLQGDKGDILRASVYVKGFGDEDAMTQFNLEQFFRKFGKVNAVRLRRTDEKLFKGSVFVEFETEDDAKAFLAITPAPEWEGNPLKIMSKKEYVDDKARAIKAGEIQPSNSNKERKFFEGRGGKSDKNRGGARGGFRGNQDDWKNRRDHDQKNGFRGGRGGRGGRGRGGRGRGGRGGHRDRDDRRDNRRDDKPVDPRDAGQPAIKTTDDSGKPVENGNGKRAREEDSAAGQPQAKKVDNKTE